MIIRMRGLNLVVDQYLLQNRTYRLHSDIDVIRFQICVTISNSYVTTHVTDVRLVSHTRRKAITRHKAIIHLL